MSIMAAMTRVVQLQRETKVKQTFSDAFYHCIDILKSKQEYITDSYDDMQSRRIFLLGHEMFEFFKKMREQLLLKEINSCQPVIEKQESPSKTHLLNPANEYSIFVNKPEDSDLKLDSDKCVDKKFEDNFEEKEQNVEADEETQKRRAIRRKVQHVVFDSSDSEDLDDDCDYYYDGNNDFSVDGEVAVPKEVKKDKKTPTDNISHLIESSEVQKQIDTRRSIQASPAVVDLSESDTPEDDSDDDCDESYGNGGSGDSKNNSDDVLEDNDEDNDEMNKSLTEKKNKRIPYSVKENVVKMSREHPNWSWQKIKVKSGCSQLHSKQTLHRWQELVESGGSRIVKRELVNKYIYEKIIETKNNNNKVTTNMLINWCFEGENKYQSEEYLAHLTKLRVTRDRLPKFKRDYNITGPSHDLQLPAKYCSKRKRGRNNRNDDDNDKSALKTKKLKTDVAKKFIIPYGEKVLTITVAMQNPSWSVNEINKYTNSKCLNNIQQLHQWARDIASGGTYYDRRTVMDYWIYSQCLEYKKNNKMFSDVTLVNWAKDAQNDILNEILPTSGKLKSKFSDKFHKSPTWLAEFKKHFNIAGKSPELYVDDNFINVHKNSERYQFDEGSSHTPIIVDIGNDMKILKIDHDALKEYIKPRRAKKIYVSFEDRVNAVKILKENPTWSLETIRKNIKGCENLKYKHFIIQWMDLIKFGPTKRDKSLAVNSWVYNKCLEHKKMGEILDSKLVKNWLIEAKKIVIPEYKGEDLFINPTEWLCFFRRQYNITGCPSDLQLGSLTDQKNNGEDSNSDADNHNSSDNESDPESVI